MTMVIILLLLLLLLKIGTTFCIGRVVGRSITVGTVTTASRPPPRFNIFELFARRERVQRVSVGMVWTRTVLRGTLVGRSCSRRVETIIRIR